MTDPNPPDLPRHLDELPDTVAPGDGDVWAEGRVQGLAAPGSSARELTIEAAVVTGSNLAGSRLDLLRLIDAVVDDCDLANVTSRAPSTTRVEVRNSRMTGLSFTSGTIRDTTFTDCRLDLAAFVATSFERVEFVRCDLREAVFERTAFDGVVLHDCDLVGADVTGARFTRSELRGCKIDALRGIESLRGVAMRRGDIIAAAGEFAAALGVVELTDELSGPGGPRPARRRGPSGG